MLFFVIIILLLLLWAVCGNNMKLLPSSLSLSSTSHHTHWIWLQRSRFQTTLHLLSSLPQCGAWLPTTGGTASVCYGGPGWGVRRACTDSGQSTACHSARLPSNHQGPSQEASQEVLLVAVGSRKRHQPPSWMWEKLGGGNPQANFMVLRGALWVGQRGHFPRQRPCKWHFIHPNPSSILCVNFRGADGENRMQRRRKQAVFPLSRRELRSADLFLRMKPEVADV